MSLMGDAFENTVSLNTGEVSNFSKPYDIGRPIVEEPPYLQATTKSSVEASELFKRVDGLRVSLNESHLKSPRAGSGGRMTSTPFLARITGSRPMIEDLPVDENPTSWYYAWESVVPEVDGSYITGSYPDIGVQESGEQYEAWNTMEAGNVVNCVGPGVCMTVDCEYPVGWTIQPIGGLEHCQVEPVVVMYQMLIGPNSPTFVFQAENAHDGTCPLEIEDPP